MFRIARRHIGALLIAGVGSLALSVPVDAATKVFGGHIGTSTGWIDHWTDVSFPYATHNFGYTSGVKWGGIHGIPSHKFRGNIWFDTWQGLPSGSTVTRVDFFYDHNVSYSGTSLSWALEVWITPSYEGIANGSDGNVAAYSPYGAQRAYTINFGGAGPSDFTADLGTVGRTVFDTDIYGTMIQLRDVSSVGIGTEWGATCLPSSCRLIVTYTPPASFLSDDGSAIAPASSRSTWSQIKRLYDR